MYGDDPACVSLIDKRKMSNMISPSKEDIIVFLYSRKKAYDEYWKRVYNEWLSEMPLKKGN